MEKITIRLWDEVRETIERNAESNGVSMSEYIRNLVESDVGVGSRVSIPKGLREIMDRDLEDGYFRDEAECVLHYIREGMRKEGRIPRRSEPAIEVCDRRRRSREDVYRDVRMLARRDGE